MSSLFHCIFSIIAHSFLEKAELEQQIKPDITEEAYVVLINESWDALIQTGFSFVIADKSNRIVGVSLSFDANNEPQCDLDGPHGVIFEFLETLESPVRLAFHEKKIYRELYNEYFGE